jgi:hypothetical protein
VVFSQPFYNRLSQRKHIFAKSNYASDIIWALGKNNLDKRWDKPAF